MVSATQLSSYLYCPRKLFISSVLLVEEPPKQELVKGRIWHQTYEWINNSEEDIVSSVRSKDYQEIFDVYRRRYSKILRDAIIRNKSSLKDFGISLLDVFEEYWPNFEEEAKERALNLVQFIEKNQVFGKDLWKRLTPKLFSEQYIKSDNLKLSGIIDVLEIHYLDNKDENGMNIEQYVPVELKTGKFPQHGMWEGHKIQLAAYMLLLEDSGKDVKEAVIKYRGADRRVLQMNSFLKDEVSDLIRKTLKLLESFDIPDYVENRNKCNSCPLKETCYNQDRVKTLVNQARLRPKKLF
ncbi:MAG: CRISPR-associated protein Cas4 [Candidatus Woesearchaeota archaeon]